MAKKNNDFMTDVALYPYFSGNDIRAILLLYSGELRQKDLIAKTGWDKGNLSRILKRLVELRVVIKRQDTETGVTYYRADPTWKSPASPGQLRLF